MKAILLTWLILFDALSDYNYEYIKLISLYRLPIVEVTLNEKKAYFLMDTGSAITMLHSGAIAEYGFKSFSRNNENHKAIGIGGESTKMSSANRVNLELGSTRIMTRYMVHDISHIVRQIQHTTGFEISGIIGSDAMKRYGIIIDYKHKRVGVLTSKKKIEEPTEVAER